MVLVGMVRGDMAGRYFPPPHGQKDNCENITFPQLRLRAVMSTVFDKR